MANTSISFTMAKVNEFLDQVTPHMAEWPDDKKRAFEKHWKAMEKNGAETVDTIWSGGVVYCAVSDDFRRALAEFGVST